MYSYHLENYVENRAKNSEFLNTAKKYSTCKSYFLINILCNFLP